MRRTWDPGQLAQQAQPTRPFSDSKKSTGPGQTACHSVKVSEYPNRSNNNNKSTNVFSPFKNDSNNKDTKIRGRLH